MVVGKEAYRLWPASPNAVNPISFGYLTALIWGEIENPIP